MSTEPITSPELQKNRLLRLTIDHYRTETCSEKDIYKWGYAVHWSPSSMRGAAKALNASLGDRWVIRDHDMWAEFWFRDMAALAAAASDPEFQKLQEAEGPYASKIHIEASLGWVEQYVADGKVVNVTPDGKPDFLSFEEMSAPPL
ncbi:Uu.00g065080.m01.CDS01 [Anthostomella pinea]|uniref:Uu.00g065080.m01.CDS01 n=1 Tax=Anthostomella pinea TaxID=933095 RepID=A0AAI8VTQ1_9PEZI|nr:Uu.00g065080.m01.CDS01 [Anthostomella pinea]